MKRNRLSHLDMQFVFICITVCICIFGALLFIIIVTYVLDQS